MANKPKSQTILEKELTGLQAGGVAPSQLLRVAYQEDLSAVARRRYRRMTMLMGFMSVVLIGIILAGLAGLVISGAQDEINSAENDRDAANARVTSNAQTVEAGVAFAQQATATSDYLTANPPTNTPIPTNTPAYFTDVEVFIEPNVTETYVGNNEPLLLTVNTNKRIELARRPFTVLLSNPLGRVEVEPIFDNNGIGHIRYYPPPMLDTTEVTVDLWVDVPTGIDTNSSETTYHGGVARSEAVTITIRKETLQVQLKNNATNEALMPPYFLVLNETTNQVELTFWVTQADQQFLNGTYNFAVDYRFAENVALLTETQYGAVDTANATFTVPLDIPIELPASPIEVTVTQVTETPDGEFQPVCEDNSCEWNFTVYWSLLTTVLRSDPTEVLEIAREANATDSKTERIRVQYSLSTERTFNQNYVARNWNRTAVLVDYETIYPSSVTLSISAQQTRINSFDTPNCVEENPLIGIDLAQGVYLGQDSAKTGSAFVCVNPQVNSNGLYKLNFVLPNGEQSEVFVLVAEPKIENLNSNEWEIINPQNFTETRAMPEQSQRESYIAYQIDLETYILKQKSPLSEEPQHPDKLASFCDNQNCYAYYLGRKTENVAPQPTPTTSAEPTSAFSPTPSPEQTLAITPTVSLTPVPADPIEGNEQP